MRVYHFLCATWAIDDLKRGRLKISRIDDLNDPFELLGAELADSNQRRFFLETKKAIAQNHGVLCFSRSWRNPLMWSHYADKHRGFCLGFDIPDDRTKPIRYDAKRLPSLIPRLLAGTPDSEALMKCLLFTKFQDWKYEAEVRVYTDLKNVDPPTGHYFAKFSDDLSLKEVIFGPRFEGPTTEIAHFVRPRFPGVTLIKARLAFGTFRVVRNKSVVV